MPFWLTGLSPCVVPKTLFLDKIAPYTRDAHACKWSRSRVERLQIFSTRSKWRPNFKIQPGNQFCLVDTLKYLDCHNEKVTLKEDMRSWNNSILIAWLSHWKSKRRQNGGTACVVATFTVEWMKNSLRTCTRTPNFSDFFLSCFLSLLSLWNGSNGTRKMSKVQLWKVMMLRSFRNLHIELCPLSLGSVLAHDFTGGS